MEERVARQVDFTPGDTSLFSMKYSSVLNAGDDNEAERILAAIMSTALQKNPNYDITGMLYYDRGARRIVRHQEMKT